MAKIFETLNHPNVLNFKNVYYQPLASIFENVSINFSQFGKVREINGLDRFLKLLNYFSAKQDGARLSKNKFRFD